MDYTDPIHGTKKIIDLVHVTYDFIPLPYHHGSWIPAKLMPYVSMQCAETPESCQFKAYLEYMLANQDMILSATDVPYTTLIEDFKTTIAAEKSLNSPKNVLDYIYSDGDGDSLNSEMTARANWKFGTSNTNTGTPIYWVNGLKQNPAANPMSPEKWMEGFDSLIKAQDSQ